MLCAYFLGLLKLGSCLVSSYVWHAPLWLFSANSSEVLSLDLVSQISLRISPWTVRVRSDSKESVTALTKNRGMYSIAGAFSGLIAVSTSESSMLCLCMLISG